MLVTPVFSTTTAPVVGDTEIPAPVPVTEVTPPELPSDAVVILP